jgi:hypothetical protein
MIVQVGKQGKRMFVASCLVLGFTSLAPFATIGTAAADGHNIVDGDGTWGAPDGAEQRGMSLVPAIHSIDTSANIAATWSAAPTWPAPASYPAQPSWPGDSSHPCCSR